MTHHHFVVVAELRDLVPRRNRDFPNLFVSVQGTNDEALLIGLLRDHPYYGDFVETIRTDLHRHREFLNSKNASAAAWRLKKKLAVAGYTVNPSLEAEYRVYVLELDTQKLCVDAAQAFYVGETAQPIEERIAEHLAGEQRSSAAVTKSFVRRRTDLEPNRVFHSRADSLAEEDKHGRKLERRGFHVEGPKGLYRKQGWNRRSEKGEEKK